MPVAVALPALAGLCALLLVWNCLRLRVCPPRRARNRFAKPTPLPPATDRVAAPYDSDAFKLPAPPHVPTFPRIDTDDLNRAALMPDLYPAARATRQNDATGEAAGSIVDSDGWSAHDQKWAPPDAAEPEAEPDVIALLADVLRCFATHRERLIRRGQPKDYSTRWWVDPDRRGGEEAGAGGRQRRRPPGRASRRGDVDGGGGDGDEAGREDAAAAEAAAAAAHEEAERATRMDYVPVEGDAAARSRPTAAVRRREAHRRVRMAQEAHRHVMGAVTLLRARLDLLSYRLPLMEAREEEALALLAGVIAATPIAGEIDSLSLTAGVVTTHGESAAFAHGTTFGHASDPFALSLQLRQAELLGGGSGAQPSGEEAGGAGAGWAAGGASPMRVLGLPSHILPSQADPSLRPAWESVAEAFEYPLCGPWSKAYPSASERDAARAAWQLAAEADGMLSYSTGVIGVGMGEHRAAPALCGDAALMSPQRLATATAGVAGPGMCGCASDATGGRAHPARPLHELPYLDPPDPSKDAGTLERSQAPSLRPEEAANMPGSNARGGRSGRAPYGAGTCAEGGPYSTRSTDSFPPRADAETADEPTGLGRAGMVEERDPRGSRIGSSRLADCTRPHDAKGSSADSAYARHAATQDAASQGAGSAADAAWRRARTPSALPPPQGAVHTLPGTRGYSADQTRLRVGRR